jgi:UDP-N-acetylmuramate--alanine ligase
MKVSPGRVGLVHFTGIGGIGMSGIARVLHRMGYQVQGSDISSNLQTTLLRAEGIAVFEGHDAQHLEGVKLVVVSTAVDPDNPEVKGARQLRIPVIRRAEMLGELMKLKESVAITGTHGKTTVTSVAGALLEKAGLEPTVISGGMINAYGSNVRAGAGAWVVVEADESDGSFRHLPGTIGVVTNINPEHMEHYQTEENLMAAFRNFVESVPFYGLVILCADHPKTYQLAGQVTDRRVVTYGWSEQAMIRAVGCTLAPGGAAFSVRMERSLVPARWLRHPSVEEGGEEGYVQVNGFRTCLAGRHNVQNVLVAVALACELDLGLDVVHDTLAGFQGVRRRFTVVGDFQGVTVVDDYAHHPVEIEAVFQAARQCWPEGRLVAVWQPHRYSRVSRLKQDFAHVLAQADHVVVLPVYAAGEPPLEGLATPALAEMVRASGGGSVAEAQGILDLAEAVADVARPGDVVLCLGAGDITSYAARLPEALAEVHRSRAAAIPAAAAWG